MASRYYNVISFGGHALNVSPFVSFFTQRNSPRDVMPSSALAVPRPHTYPALPYFERSFGKIRLQVQFDCTDNAAALEELNEVFDVYDVTAPPRPLVIEDESGVRWTKTAKAVSLFKAVPQVEESFFIDLVSEDPEWASETLQEDDWAIVATPSYRVLTLDGNRPALPKLSMTPTSAIAGNFAHRRFVSLYNRVPRSLVHYPLEITGAVSAATGFDTATEIAAARMQADGDDLRVYVNGEEVDRWFSNINTDHTHVWIVVDMPPRARTYTDTAIGLGDNRFVIQSRRTQGEFPRYNGHILIEDAVAGNEVVSYRWFNGNRFGGCERGLCDTADVAHAAANVTIWYLPLIVWIYHGNAALTAPWQDDRYSPIIELDTSWNGTWDFDDFGDEDRKRAARWVKKRYGSLRRLRTTTAYTSDQGTDADPWDEAGLMITKDNPPPPGDYFKQWMLEMDVPVATVDYSGEHQEDHVDDLFYLYCMDWLDAEGWASVHNNSLSGSVGVWGAWAAGGPHACRTGALKLRLLIRNIREGDDTGFCYVEVGDFILTQQANKYPLVDMDDRHDTPYHLQAEVFNISTDQGMDIDYVFRIVNRQIKLDCKDKTARIGQAGRYGRNMIQVVTRSRDDIRFPWIELTPKRSNLAENWGFEYWPTGGWDKQPYAWTDWEVLGGGTAENNAETDPEFIWEGDSALRVDATNLIGVGTWKGVSQAPTVAEGRLTAGTWYTLSGWVRNPTIITNGELVIEVVGAATGVVDAIPLATTGPHAAWTHYTVDFQMTAPDVLLTIYVGIRRTAANASGIAWFDNITLKPRDTDINCLKYTETGVVAVTFETDWHDKLTS